MLSSIFVALLQAVAGDPAAPAAAETFAVEAPAAQTDSAPRMERVRVCRTYEASTGGRLSQRRCRWEERPVRDEATPDVDTTSDTGATVSADDASDAGADRQNAAPTSSGPSPQ